MKKKLAIVLGLLLLGLLALAFIDGDDAESETEEDFISRQTESDDEKAVINPEENESGTDEVAPAPRGEEDLENLPDEHEYSVEEDS